VALANQGGDVGQNRQVGVSAAGKDEMSHARELTVISCHS
jgi:hypothetical protein